MGDAPEQAPASWVPPDVRLEPPEPERRPCRGFMRSEEVARSRLFFQLVLVVALLTAAFVPALEGAAWLRMAAVVLCSAAALICVGALVVLRQPARYTPAVATAIAASTSTLGVAVIYYIGPFSAGAMILTLGVYFFGTSGHPRPARAAYGVVAGLYLFASGGIASGLLPDLSLFETTHERAFTQWFQVLMSQVILGATFYVARSSRRATDAALERLRAANRDLRRREALLAEARGELARATRPARGRYTGEMIEGYAVGDLLGRGAMGEVYRAKSPSREAVALKVLHPELVEDQKKVRRFLREAEAASAVESPHVPRVHVSGWLEGETTPFLVMDLLQGHDLRWHLQRAGTLALDDVVEMTQQVARALADVRDAGVVHRDLKPANVFLTDSLPRTWKVLDFGLSKLAGSKGSLTGTHAVGTPSYMSPEQVTGPTVDHQSDLYALAAIVYRALCGVPPFAGNDVGRVLYRVVHEQPAAPTQLGAIPPDVELALAIGMAKRPDDRFARVEELAHALEAAVEGTLGEPLRARARAILTETPWGSRSDAA